MLKAQANLRASGQTSDLNVRTTHLYLKFKPHDEEELDLLKSDTTLILYDYPLDYEIAEGSVSYHDPKIPIGKPTYQYVAVKVDKKLPRLDYEVLANLYIPEEDGQIINGRASGDASVDVLVDEALKITNNFEEGTNEDKNGRRASWWTPAGTIRVWDDVVGETTITNKIFDHWEYYPCGDGEITIEIFEEPGACKRAIFRDTTIVLNGSIIPIEGVKVRARRWFTTYRAYTNKDGYFNMILKFKHAANYSIKWETVEYDIRDGLFVQAYYNGPKQTGNWNLDITGGKSLRFATIHRGAYRYHFQDIGGLKRPNLQYKLRYAYMDKDGKHGGIHWGNNWWHFVIGPAGIRIPNIKIWGKSDFYNGGYRPTNDIFSTTVHETGHASHIELMNVGVIQWKQASTIIQESWPEAVTWQITRLEYVELGEVDFDNPQVFSDINNKQWWSSSINHDYTPLFIDLVDNYNQDIERSHEVPVDRIHGYSLSEIESGYLKYIYGLSSFKDKIKSNKPSGVTDQQIDDYLAYYLKSATNEFA